MLNRVGERNENGCFRDSLLGQYEFFFPLIKASKPLMSGLCRIRDIIRTPGECIYRSNVRSYLRRQQLRGDGKILVVADYDFHAHIISGA